MNRIGGWIAVLLVSALAGCHSSQPTATWERSVLVTPEFLKGRGFVQDSSYPEIYRCRNITVGEAMRRLDFTRDQMHPIPSQRYDSDSRSVKILDAVFIIESEMRDADGHVIRNSLDSDDALCTVSVSLVHVNEKFVRPKH